MRIWYHKNPEKVKAQEKRRNPLLKGQRSVKWRRLHRERINKYMREYAKRKGIKTPKRTEWQKVKRRERDRRNIEKKKYFRLIRILWDNNYNPKPTMTKWRRRCVLKKASRKRMLRMKRAGPFPKKEWEEKLKKHNYRCVFCGTRKKITIDHKVPLCKGGTNKIENLQPLCMRCNQIKNTQIFDV